MSTAGWEPLIDPLDALQLALDVAAIPHHPLDPRLHPYQRDSVAHLHANPRAALFLIPGLGKTAITLSALTTVHTPVLVIAPKKVAEETWPAEIAKWRPDLTYSLVRGSAPVRQERLAKEVDIHIISRDTFGVDLMSRKKKAYQTIVIDELSGFKNRGSQRWRHLNKLVKTTPYVWGLTGTPTPNTLLDLWPQVFLLDRGARLERTITAYRTRYFAAGKRLPNGIITKWNLRPGSQKIIENKVRDLCLSVDKSNVEMPIKNEVIHRIVLPRAARKAYDKMNDEFVADIEETLVSVEHGAAKTGKMAQIASGFMYHSGFIGLEESDEAETTHYHMLRLEKVKEILEDAQGAPALVFYKYKEDKRRLLMLDGVVDIKSPNAVDRWNRGNIPILIAHPKSAGHGLNLQHGGSLLIWYNLDWSSEDYVQATGRLVRQGQPSPVVAVHHIIATDTVDEDMYEVVQGRISRQDALLKVMERGSHGRSRTSTSPG